MLPGNSFHRSDALLLQHALLGAGGLPSCLLSLPLPFGSPGCARTRRRESIVGGWSPRHTMKRSTGGRNDTGKHLVWAREQGRKRTRTRWEAGPIVQAAKALSLHLETQNEVVLPCGMKFCLQGESPTLLFKPGDFS